MDLDTTKALAIELMDKHGLLDDSWYFEFDNSKRRFGVCNYTYKKIGLSSILTQLNEELKVRDTILHEIAHALVGQGHGHDRVWKAKAIEIGCNGKRCYDNTKVITPTGKYTSTCKAGHVHKRFKAPKHKQSCGLCSRVFNPNNILEWVKTK